MVVDGAGYVRTNSSRWLENIQRDPEVQLRVRGYEYLMRAEEVKDGAVKERVEERLQGKYGFTQTLMSFFRFGSPPVLRLVPRTSGIPGAH